MPIKSFLIISKFKDLNIGFELLYAKSKFSYDIVLNFVISSMTGLSSSIFNNETISLNGVAKYCIICSELEILFNEGIILYTDTAKTLK